MSNEKDQLMSTIDRLVEESTFSLEATRAVAALRERAATLEAQLEAHVVRVDHLEEQVKEGRRAQDLAESEARDWRQREAELVEREKKCLQTEVENRFWKDRHQDMRDIAMGMTRNIEYRRSLAGMENRQDNHGYTNSFPYSHVEDHQAT